jgi:hypothetical protein
METNLLLLFSIRGIIHFKLALASFDQHRYSCFRQKNPAVILLILGLLFLPIAKKNKTI